MVINQVDVSRIKSETWRFCRQCAYTEPLSSGDTHPVCPRCGDSLWRDSGRVRDMLRLTTVFARTLDRDSRIADDADERQRGFYVRQALVDSPPDVVRQAFVIDRPEFPFGFEFLDRVTFREVNLGEQAPDASPMTIAGEELSRPGFSICPECGTLQRKRKAEEQHRNHAPWCAKRKHPDAGAQQCIFLYREFTSEGIRLFLPEVGFAESHESLLSFVAALELGLAKRFKGAVDHLRIAPDIRMAAGSDRPRTYLVIYDSVPGGTGYLKELMRDPEPLFEVFGQALQALNTCACNQNVEADGCYRWCPASPTSCSGPTMALTIWRWLCFWMAGSTTRTLCPPIWPSAWRLPRAADSRCGHSPGMMSTAPCGGRHPTRLRPGRCSWPMTLPRSCRNFVTSRASRRSQHSICTLPSSNCDSAWLKDNMRPCAGSPVPSQWVW